MTNLTAEQERKIKTFYEAKKFYLEKIDFITTLFLEYKRKFQESVIETSSIINNGDYNTIELFIKERLPLKPFKDYRPQFYLADQNNKNPYTYINDYIKEISNTSIEEIFDLFVVPFFKETFNLDLPGYKENYIEDLFNYEKFFDNNHEEFLIKKFDLLQKAIEEDDLINIKKYSKSIQLISKDTIEANLFNMSLLIRTILHYGNALLIRIDGLALPQQTVFTLNKDFANKTVQLSKDNSLSTISSNAEQINTDYSRYTLEEVKEITDLKRAYDLIIEDRVDSKKLTTDADKLVTTSKDLEEDFNSLKEYLDNIVTKNTDSFGRLINLTGTEKENVINAAVDNYNIFQYIFHSDARTISIYNNPKNLDNPESSSVDYNFYNSDYYINWVEPFEKIIPGKENYIDLTSKLENIKAKLDTDNLLINDIEEVSQEINDLIISLTTEVKPNLDSFYKSMKFFTFNLSENKEDFLKLLNIELEPDLYLPFNIKQNNESFLYEIQTKIYTLALSKVNSLITNLETLLANLKKDTIEDIIEDKNFKANASITNIIETIEYGVTESKKLCGNIIVSEKLSTSIFVTNPEDFNTNNIYVLIYDDKFIAIYNRMKNALIHTYEPLNKKVADIVAENDYFSSVALPLLTTPEEYYRRWCHPSRRTGRDAQPNTRFGPLLKIANNLKLAIESNSPITFKQEKKKALELIEEDLHPDIAMYFIATEIFDVNNSNQRIKSDNELYMPAYNTNYNYDRIAELKYNSYQIIETLIYLHKAITDLEFLSNKEDIENLVNNISKSNLEEVINKKNEEREKEELIDLPKENWGIRISPANAFKNVNVIKKEPAVDNSGKPTKEQEVNTTIDVYKQETTSFGKSWYMMLLPTMTSNLPVTGGSQTPGAQPGLNFRIVNSLVKHKIPGFGPVYQPMGIDTINCTIVGCFTGADGSDKYKIGNIDNFSDGGYNYSNDLFGLNGEIGNQSRFLDDVVHRFDSFENFQSFYNEIIQTNKEIEVEINLKKNTNVLANGSEGIFRDSTTGNPKFKGFIKRFDSYYVRDDRTWYIMDVQLTTNHIISKKCLNLTNIVEEAVPTTTLEESLGVTPFNLIAECLFEDTPGVGGPPKLPKDIYFGPLNGIKRFLGGSPAGKFAKNWNGVTLYDNVNAKNNTIRLSINSKGYSVKYEVVREKDYRILGKPYLTPSETFDEVNKDNWSIDEKMKYIIQFHCIQNFLSRRSPNPEQVIDEVPSPKIQISVERVESLNPIEGTDVGTTSRNFIQGVFDKEAFVDFKYNKVTGKLIRQKKNQAEYEPLEFFDPAFLHDGSIKNPVPNRPIKLYTDKYGVEYRKYMELFRVLKAEALLEFKKDEELEERCKNKSKEKARALSEKEKVDTTDNNSVEKIDLAIKFTKNDLQIKLKNYIVNNHKEFIQQNSITYNNSNQSRLYFVEDIRELNYLEEVSSQFFVDKFTVVDNEDSYFTIDVETKSLKGLRYVTPTTNFVLKLFGGINQESANRLIITIEKKDNKPGRILRTVPYSQYTKPTQTQR